MCQLVGEHDGKVVVPVYDWASFLPVKKIPGIKMYHQFTMSSAEPGKGNSHFVTVW